MSILKIKREKILVFDQILVSAFTFLSSFIIARVFPKEEYANFVLLNSAMMIYVSWQRSIFSQSAIINQPQKNHLVYWKSVLYIYMFAVVTFALVSGIYFFSISSKSYHSNFYFWLLPILYGIVNFKRDIAINSLGETFKLSSNIVIYLTALFVLLYSVYNRDYELFLCLLSLVFFLSFLFDRNFYVDSIKNRSYTLDKSSLIYTSKWLILSNIFYTITGTLIPFYLSYLTNSTELAYYGVLMSISGIFNPVQKFITSLLLPSFISDNASIDVRINSISRYTGLIMVPTVILVFFFGENIIGGVYGAGYSFAGSMLFVVVLTKFIEILGQPLDTALNALNRPDILFKIGLTRSFFFAVAIMLSFLLVGQVGLLMFIVVKAAESCWGFLLMKYFLKRVRNASLIH